jgi:DNA-binding transcriptional MerR regulator
MRVPTPMPPSQNTPEIPDKLYFRIGEVAHIAGVEPYVLRFWESEFPQLAPKKSGTGHRLYRRKEVELILELKRLLYEKRFTIEGARLWLEQNKKRGATRALQPSPPPPQAQPSLFSEVRPGAVAEIRKGLAEILELLR